MNRRQTAGTMNKPQTIVLRGHKQRRGGRERRLILPMERVRILITRGSTALTRATKMAAMNPKLKISRRMKKLPARKAVDRKPDKAHVVALHSNRHQTGPRHHHHEHRSVATSAAAATTIARHATQVNRYEAQDDSHHYQQHASADRTKHWNISAYSSSILFVC